MHESELDLNNAEKVTGGRQEENYIPPAVKDQIRSMAESLKSRGYTQREAISLLLTTFSAYPAAEVAMIVTLVYK